MAGRKSLKTPVVIDKLLESLAIGHTKKDACTLAGISDETLMRWMKEDMDFMAQVAKAELVAKDQSIKSVRKAAIHEWQAAKWWLSVKAKDEFSERQELTGKDGGPVELANLQIKLKDLLKSKINGT